MSVRQLRWNGTGIVLAGGHPWSDSPFDRLSARSLLPVAHRPLISYSLAWLKEAGIDVASVCANRETSVLKTRLLRHTPKGLAVSYHEDAMPRGAAGAVRDAAMTHDSDVFIVADGTMVPSIDLHDLLEAHHASGAKLTVVAHVEPGKRGKAPMQVPSGIYVFTREAVEAIPARGFVDIKEHLIPRLHTAGCRISAYLTNAVSPRVLDATSYRAVNAWAIEHLLAAPQPPEGYRHVNGCLVHEDAEVDPDAMFIGPSLVGPGARIRAGAVIVGPSSIGRDATIGNGVLVSRSAIWRRAVLRERAFVDRSILADGTIVAPHTQVFHAIVAPDRDSRSQQQPPTQPTPRVGSFELIRRMSRSLVSVATRTPAA